MFRAWNVLLTTGWCFTMQYIDMPICNQLIVSFENCCYAFFKLEFERKLNEVGCIATCNKLEYFFKHKFKASPQCMVIDKVSIFLSNGVPTSYLSRNSNVTDWEPKDWTMHAFLSQLFLLTHFNYPQCCWTSKHVAGCLFVTEESWTVEFESIPAVYWSHWASISNKTSDVL